MAIARRNDEIGSGPSPASAWRSRSPAWIHHVSGEAVGVETILGGIHGPLGA
ncbi:MAG: hypothetical protein HYR86_10750 [Candidatus Rokubacteria bacterium]|nr:hypothetical protein [Candidatus Rokubacteria bacterium]